MEDLRDGGEVAREVPLGALGHATTAPGNQDILGQPRVGVLDLDVGELDTTLAEILNQVVELALWKLLENMTGNSDLNRRGEGIRTSGGLDF